jgi:hypothetical protein
VAFFALVPLALGCITQPVGRVFDTPAELRFYMRLNPLVCAGDVLHFFIRILIDYSVEPCWSWRHFRGALADRFRDTDWSASPPKFEQAAIGRWVLIVLGGIPCQTVKLVAMGGIPVTQSLALMYAVALVFGEALNVFAEACLRHRGAGSAPAAHPSSRPQLSPTIQKLLSAYVYFLLHTIQALQVWWLTKNLLRKVEEAVLSERSFWEHEIIGSITPSTIILPIIILGHITISSAPSYGGGDYTSLFIPLLPFFIFSYGLTLFLTELFFGRQ